MPSIINGEAALDEALGALAAADPLIGELVQAGARPPLRLREPGFPGLAAIIVAQQLSVASADAIWARVRARFDPLKPRTFLAASDEDLRACGLSLPKMRGLRAVALAIAEGRLMLDSLGAMAPEDAIAALTAVKGIGPWTAEIYLLFCLGHPDIFPAGDLALQEAARLALRLDERPREKQLRAIAAERWRPYRGVAARVLWAYYRIARRGREGAPLLGADSA
ncbi:DNA-3-methyladenine glycosylase family protein [Chelatococcus composti]|uniref:DNA-3-methyladenine glycosylase II n=1 Tax=Chelatococcus composti TaxID=1743235 RepID=A0A841KBD2_9HYPH|nr:DNA-3-methyladenine glycosylase 2 family protein [Chelatococcus composti]MBB6169751.1 DNA-3-methyladenine glycosylase II [Chelatococcus composti]MBS7736278.1 DNA-3-methyladenine glycosylase 2 family protein [Chelatococcus composti]GGG50046.1 DNA-3-methyladenine glycosidase [Chelatococcus composti]